MKNRQQDMGADGTGECVFSVRIEGGLAHLSISMNGADGAGRSDATAAPAAKG